MYQLTKNEKFIKRISDGAFIPADNINNDYQDYLTWLADGNKPLPFVLDQQEEDKKNNEMIKYQIMNLEMDQLRPMRELLLNNISANDKIAANLELRKIDTSIKDLRTRIKTIQPEVQTATLKTNRV